MCRFFSRSLSFIGIFLLIVTGMSIPGCAGASESWYVQTVDEGKVGNGTSLALDSQGYAHISYIDFGNGSLRYARQDGSGWHTATVDTHVAGNTKTSLALDALGNPHISYYDGKNGALVFAEYSSLQSDITTVNGSLKIAESRSTQWTGTYFYDSDFDIGRTGNSTSLALDRKGDPHISYTDFRTGALGYATRNGTVWSIVVVDPDGGVFSSIALDANESPHIAYIDLRKHFLKYAENNGSAWKVATVDIHGGIESSLALDSRNQPHITYANFTGGTLNYAWYDETGWHFQVIDPDSSSGWGSSLRLNARDEPSVAYRKTGFCLQSTPCGPGGLRLARKDAEGWNSTTLVTGGGAAASLALDALGNPHIGYFDAGAGAVKYVRTIVQGEPRSEPVASTRSEELPNHEMDQSLHNVVLLVGIVSVIFCFYYWVTSRFSKSPGKTPFRDNCLNVLLFPDETKIFFLLVILLSFTGITRMLLFFPDLLGEFSRAILQHSISPGIDFALLILIPFVILAFSFYYIRPSYIIRKEGMVRLQDRDPAIAEKIAELAGSLGLTSTVTAMFSPDKSVDIYTFGTHRGHYLVMNLGFIEKFYQRDDEFRAILYHELAHVRSGDVKRTELALAFLTALLCFAVIFLGMGITVIANNFFRYGTGLGSAGPSPDVSLHSGTPANPAGQNFVLNFSTGIVVVALMAIAIWFLIRFIIQYRELYADRMATQLMGERVSLERALTRMQAIAWTRGKRHGFFSYPAYLVFPRYHPTVQNREAFIEDPGKFFSSSLSLPFIIGFAVVWFFQMAAVFQIMYHIPLGPETMLVSVYVPGVLLAAALLLPRLTSQVLLPYNKQPWYSNPVVVSLIFMTGYAMGAYIITNLNLVLDLTINRLLSVGSPLEFNEVYVFMGVEYPAYHPAMVLFGSGVTALSVLAILLVSLMITYQLVQITGVPVLNKHPVLTFFVLPYLYAALVVSLILYNDLLGLILLLAGLVILVLARKKIPGCPVCATPLPGGFDPGISCPGCGFDYGWWIKNAK